MFSLLGLLTHCEGFIQEDKEVRLVIAGEMGKERSELKISLPLRGNPVQSGCRTGNRKKLSSSQAQQLDRQYTWLLLSFSLFPVRHTLYPPCKPQTDNLHIFSKFCAHPSPHFSSVFCRMLQSWAHHSPSHVRIYILRDIRRSFRRGEDAAAKHVLYRLNGAGVLYYFFCSKDGITCGGNTF